MYQNSYNSLFSEPRQLVPDLRQEFLQKVVYQQNEDLGVRFKNQL